MIALNSSDFSKPSIRYRLNTLFDIYFSEIDKAFLLWGATTFSIFSLAQFSSISWFLQALIDAALTGAVIAITSGLTWSIATQVKLRWVILLWAGLMTAGTVATAYGIFYSGIWILSHLCLLWLSLCAVGYGAMAVGMRSCCFSAVCLVHFCAIDLLNYTLSCQFFSSGLVIASALVFFSFIPWDMQTSKCS